MKDHTRNINEVIADIKDYMAMKTCRFIMKTDPLFPLKIDPSSIRRMTVTVINQ